MQPSNNNKHSPSRLELRKINSRQGGLAHERPASTMLGVLVFLVAYQVSYVACFESNRLVERWNSPLTYSWPDGINEADYVADGRYIPGNLLFSAIAVHNNVTYAALPRLKAGVPWVLVKVNSTLEPWIPYDQQRPGQCGEVQNPLALDIDHDNELLYVLDNGRTEIHTDQPDNTCPPKIMAYDLTGKVVLSQNIDAGVVSSDSVLLSFVFDKPGDSGPIAKHAFIADGGTGKIIVHNFEQQKSWSFKDPRMYELVNQNVTINNDSVRVRYGINALAMSPVFDHVYFTSSGSANFYQIPVSALLDLNTDIASNIRTLSTTMGVQWTMVNALTSTSEGIYFSAQARNNIRRWRFFRDFVNQGLTYPEDFDKITMNYTRPATSKVLDWPYAVSVDEYDYLYYLSSNLELLFDGYIRPLHGGSNSNKKYLYKTYLHETGYHNEMDQDNVVG